MPSTHGSNRPWGLSWRSNTIFILASVTLGLFSDIAMYGLVVPILPFMLHDYLGIPAESIQASDSVLLAAFAGSQLFFSVPVGWLTDQYRSRQGLFLLGLGAMMAGTLMFALGRNLPMLIAARILQGMSGAVVWTVGFALVMDTVGTKNMGKTMGSVSQSPFCTYLLLRLYSDMLQGLFNHFSGHPPVSCGRRPSVPRRRCDRSLRARFGHPRTGLCYATTRHREEDAPEI